MTIPYAHRIGCRRISLQLIMKRRNSPPAQAQPLAKPRAQANRNRRRHIEGNVPDPVSECLGDDAGLDAGALEDRL